MKTSTEPSTRVLCIDDNSDMRLMMQMLIKAENGMQSIGFLSSAKNLIKSIESLTSPPNVIVLDASIPGEDPLAEMKQVSARFPAIKTVVYSGHDDPTFLMLVMSCGAWGCVSKREEPDVIICAIRAVAGGNTWFPGNRTCTM